MHRALRFCFFVLTNAQTGHCWFPSKMLKGMIALDFPLVSAIILNFNGKKKLGDILVHCVSSVLDSDYPNLEVVFFDNGSTDDSVEFVKEKFKTDKKLRIIGIPKNCGPSEGYNKAIEHTRGKYVLILNNDIEVEKNSIQELVEAMERDPAIGIAQGKTKFLDRLRIQSAGGLMDLTLTTRYIGCNEEDKGQYESIIETTVPHGACMILRSSMIQEIGLFDSNYLFYHDDHDLGMRARLAGFKVMYIPSSVFYHKEGGPNHTFLKSNEGTYYDINSRVGLFIKNLELKSMLRIGIPVFTNNVISISKLIARGGAIYAVKSVFWSLRNLRNDLSRRQIVQKR